MNPPKYNVKAYKKLVIKDRKKAHILVEGHNDDEKFYGDIVYNIQKDYIVEPINRYKNTSNCNAIIEFMEELAKILDDEEQKKYFLGIIDGDARKYKNDMPTKNDLLYVLEYYSWESYFIHRETVVSILKHFYIRTLITKKTVDYIYNDIKNHLLDELWLCILEKLKDNIECKEKKSGMIRKDTPLARLDNDKNFLRNKKKILLEFAKDKKLIKSEKTILEIAKGKFALWFFIRKFVRLIEKLPQLCINGNIEKCNYCKDEKIANCSYKMKKGELSDESLELEIKRLTNLSSLTPIKQRISQLK